MPSWIRKTLVVMFTILTFGLVTPPQLIIPEAKANEPTKADLLEGTEHTNSDSFNYIKTEQSSPPFLERAIVHAELQSIQKFGPSIEKNIGDEFREVILPKMEEVILLLASKLPEEQLNNLVISKHQAGGTSEKIFHIYDRTNGNDLVRFHVRRDHPPLDGYYFNFHYHTFEDSFQIHHDLGSIYWDKNTPPNWQVS